MQIHRKQIIIVFLAFLTFFVFILWKTGGDLYVWNMLTIRPAPDPFFAEHLTSALPTPIPSTSAPDTIINIEKILDEVPSREINTTKQEYEALGWNRYENKEISFEIYYPGDWKVSESKGWNTSDEPPYMSITFAPKSLLIDFTFALYIYKEPLKERLLTVAGRGWLPVEKLRVNNADAVVVGHYSEEGKHTFKDIIFGSNIWAIGFVSEQNDPSVYERMFKSFRSLSEK